MPAVAVRRRCMTTKGFGVRRSRRWLPPAMTLIEVVASLTLLGTLLGAAVVAQQRLNRQWESAHRRARAVTALDRQLDAFTVVAPEPPEAMAPVQNVRPLATTAPTGTKPAATVPEGAVAESAASVWPTRAEGELSGTPWRWRAAPWDVSLDDAGTIGVTRFEAYDPADPAAESLAVLDVLTYRPCRSANGRLPQDQTTANPSALFDRANGGRP